jgi:hypothetical protein
VNRLPSIVVAAAGLAALGGGIALSRGGDSPLVERVHARAAIASFQPSTYSVAVTQICAGAVLFERTHSIGTRSGAVAVARDIRTSGERRVNRAAAVPKPPSKRQLAARWIALEHRLIELYASDYLRIWNAIERADTPKKRAQLPGVLQALIDAPQALERRAAALEADLHVPDCTGGSAGRTSGPSGLTSPAPA